MKNNRLVFFCTLSAILFASALRASDWRFNKTDSKIPQDMEKFWESTRNELNKVPLEAIVTPINEAVPYRQFKITLRSLNNVKITALFSLPVQGEGPGTKPWPVVVTVPGYGGSQQGVMLSECQRGYAILQVFPRGQGESAEFHKINSDKLTGKLDQPERAYYQGAYADMMRAIDYVMSRNDLDHKRIALVGTSQGGGISLAVAGIDQRIKTVIAHVPFLCNFRLAATIDHSLVKQLLDKAGMNNEQALNTLDYFDPLNLAPKIHVPVLMSAGGKDTVCPKATIRSVYERIPGSKRLKLYPNLTHTSCLDFYNQSWIWLARKLK